MARGTLGTGMMAPLSMANNFNGPYYAGPSGAAMGALMASQAIADGFRDWGESKGRQQEEARVQAERDRARMDELNQRSAVYQALNPGVQMQSANGMSNRDMDRKMAMPDAGTQMSLYNVAEAKRKEAQALELDKKKNFANAYFAQGGHKVDPTGEKFAARFGYNPYEIGDTGIIARMEEKEAQRQWQEQMKREGWTQAQILKGMGGGPAPKRDLFVDPKSGKYIYVNEGEDIPQGLIPHTNNMGVTVNSDGTTTINTGGAGRSIPTSAVASLTGNFSTLSKIDNALVANEAAPGSTGSWKGMLNDVAPSLLNKLYSDEDEVLARAATADLGSMIIHDRSGAAVTLSEYPRLRPFIPTMYDSDEEKKTKLKQLRAGIAEETRLYADNFGPEMGYKRPASWDKYLLGDAAAPMVQQQGNGSAPTRQKVGPRPGTIVDGYEYLGGDPNDQGSWRPANGR